LFCGRAHYYEGHGLAQVTFPIRVLAALGVSSILLTNAAGAINPRFRPGDFMMLTDHLNLSGLNPLRGLGVVGSGQFVDLSELYDPGLCRILKRAAKLAHTPLRAGVYAWMPGPSYETPAEVRALAKLGADAVGMSTVHEAIVARQCGLRTVAVSCLTNQAAGRSPRALCHREVLLAAVRASARAVRLLEQFARLYGKEFAGARRRA
jgi:purine-nucleoside phosphorylase